MSSAELISLVQTIASLNLGYLQVSVAIFAFLGTVFALVFYFVNVKPLRQKLDKQEQRIEEVTNAHQTQLNEGLTKALDDIKQARIESETANKELRERIENELLKQIQEAHLRIALLEAESCRTFALICEHSMNLPALAFMWWLDTAEKFANSNSTFTKMSLTSATNLVAKCDVNDLKGHIPEYERSIAKIVSHEYDKEKKALALAIKVAVSIPEKQSK